MFGNVNKFLERFEMKNGKIAIPSNNEGGMDGERSGHFGHCDVFTLVDVKDSQIEKVEVVSNKEHAEGGCLVPVKYLESFQVNAIVVGGIGMRPLVGFNDAGIDVYFDGTEPTVKAVVNSLINNKLEIIQSQQACGGGNH